MADVKISALPAATTPLAGTEVLPIVQSSTTKQVSIANVTAGRAISASSLTLTTQLSVANGGTGLTSLTAGYIPFGGSTTYGSDSNLFWDNTNKRLGLGIATPIARIDSRSAYTALGGYGQIFLCSTDSQGGDIGGSMSFGGSYTGTTPTYFAAIGGFKENSVDGNFAGYMAFGTRANGGNTTEKLRITSAGAVGINATSSQSSAKLFVAGDAALQAIVGTAGDAFPTLRFYNNNSTGFTNAGISATVGSTVNSGNLLFLTNSAGDYQERMRLDQYGNLGLGVTPSAWDSAIKAFQINNQGAVWSISSSNPNVWMSANTRLVGSTYYYVNAGVASYYGQSGGQHQWFNAASGSAGSAITFTQAMTLDASGQLSIGTTNASSSKLKVATSSNTRALVLTDDNTSDCLFIPGVSSGVFRLGPDYGALAFYTGSSGGSERARITSAGDLLVGRTSQVSGEKFVVEGNVSGWIERLRNTATSTAQGLEIVYTASTPNNADSPFLFCVDSTALRMSVRSNGGIANYQGNDANLSDERLKTEIANAPSYLNKICLIPVRTFKYKDQTHDDLNLGVIAQEVEAVAPELVDTDGFGNTPDDGVPYKAIYQTDLQYALMKSIQELAANEQELRSRVSALEAKQ